MISARNSQPARIEATHMRRVTQIAALGGARVQLPDASAVCDGSSRRVDQLKVETERSRQLMARVEVRWMHAADYTDAPSSRAC
jgi:hypothetical protein